VKKDDCIFCKLANGEIPTNTLYEDDKVRVIFDTNPAADGHVLVLPKEHFDNAYEVSEEYGSHMFVVASRMAAALHRELKCPGVNILQNNGEAAGQTVFHIHMHVIPRYENDTVNMTWKQGQLNEKKTQELMEKLQHNEG
jgi:histidine triad (HIT) family protein